MEILVKCDQSEEAEVYAMMRKLCPDLAVLLNRNVEIKSLEVRFQKTGEMIEIDMTPDVSKMAIRKISAAGSVFKVLWHIMNDSLSDLIDKMGEFDVIIDDIPIESADNFDIISNGKDSIPTMAFHGI